MTGLDWIPLYEDFGRFSSRAKKFGLFSRELEIIENGLEDMCPFPKKVEKPIEVSDDSQEMKI